MPQRNGKHFVRRCHFQVERFADNASRQAVDVRIADVTPVFAQMRSDAVGAGFHRDQRCPDGVGKLAAARISDCRHMVDVDAEA
jgi:hypothetical protein